MYVFLIECYKKITTNILRNSLNDSIKLKEHYKTLVLLWHTKHVTIFIGYVFRKENICIYFLVCINILVSSAKTLVMVRKRSSCFTV